MGAPSCSRFDVWSAQKRGFSYFTTKAEAELDPVKRVAMHIQLNDMVVNNRVVIPVIARSGVSAMNLKLVANPSGWDSNFWDLQDWFKDA